MPVRGGTQSPSKSPSSGEVDQVRGLLAAGYAHRVQSLVRQARLVVSSDRSAVSLPEDLAWLEQDAGDLLELVGEPL